MKTVGLTSFAFVAMTLGTFPTASGQCCGATSAVVTNTTPVYSAPVYQQSTRAEYQVLFTGATYSNPVTNSTPVSFLPGFTWSTDIVCYPSGTITSVSGTGSSCSEASANSGASAVVMNCIMNGGFPTIANVNCTQSG